MFPLDGRQEVEHSVFSQTTIRSDLIVDDDIEELIPNEGE